MRFRAKAILPNKEFDSKFLEAAIVAEAEIIADEMLEEFEKTVQAFDNKPEFESKVTYRGRNIVSISVTTTDENYRRLDVDGTRKHTIVPKRKKVLVFREQYDAKTTPGVIASKSGGPRGKLVYAKKVTVRGIQPRLFSRTIRKQFQPEVPERLQKAIDEGAEKSGYTI